MSQDSVYKFLESNDGEFTAKHIANEIGISHGSVRTALNKLFKGKEVKKRLEGMHIRDNVFLYGL